MNICDVEKLVCSLPKKSKKDQWTQKGYFSTTHNKIIIQTPHPLVLAFPYQSSKTLDSINSKYISIWHLQSESDALIIHFALKWWCCKGWQNTQSLTVSSEQSFLLWKIYQNIYHPREWKTNILVNQMPWLTELLSNPFWYFQVLVQTSVTRQEASWEQEICLIHL